MMSLYLSLLLLIYLVGQGAFLLCWRDHCAGGWLEVACIALAWPIVLCVVWYAYLFMRDEP